MVDDGSLHVRRIAFDLEDKSDMLLSLRCDQHSDSAEIDRRCDGAENDAEMALRRRGWKQAAARQAMNRVRPGAGRRRTW